ncbi:MAG: preprotein translocase subunit Sec61beta [Nitrososphaerota archaeon]
MSEKKRKNAPLPASSAGLLRFFEDDTPGVRTRPEIVVSIGIALIVASIMLLWLFPHGL